MSRPLRIQIANGIYHLTTRGNAKQPVFADAGDRRIFLAHLSRVLGRFGWQCLTYCLMENHYHLVVQTPQPNLARGMQLLNGGYARRFNHRHARQDHVWGKPYDARLIADEAYLLTVARYVARNPVTAGVAARCGEWHWSGHRELAGLEPCRLVTSTLILDQFGSLAAARRRYVAFVEDSDGPELVAETTVLGPVSAMAAHLPDAPPSPEIARRDWQATRPPLREILPRNGTDRQIAVAYRQYGYTMREIAEMLGRHYSTVSRRLKDYEDSADVAMQDLTPGG
jgi:REP element-mobilizing transposase RayT